MAVASFLNNPLGGWSANTPEAMSLYADDEWKRRNADEGTQRADGIRRWNEGTCGEARKA
jgi:hypothetical protein